MKRLRQYLSTIRYLKARQVFYQIRHRLAPPALTQHSAFAPNYQPIPLSPFPQSPASHRGKSQFQFLNQPAHLGTPLDWNAPSLPKLWQYNLHYFDFLRQPNLSADQGLSLIEHWIDQHLPARNSVGWEPYPLSLRVVNWLKFFTLVGRVPSPGVSGSVGPVPSPGVHMPSPGISPKILQNLSLQGENLERQIEYHILGNHLFANGKALWFLGQFLGNPRWTAQGQDIVLRQLPEQFLPDGGHFELSPMYHSLMLEDLLDLINLTQNAPAKNDDALRALRTTAAKALGWLNAIVDANNKIPLLNDAAFGIAPEPAELNHYAATLNLRPDDSAIPQTDLAGWTLRNLSGYQILTRGPFRLLFDAALLGPDYLPGHAHGDLLSVLFDLNGQPIFTDTGVFDYAETPTRRWARGTAAHNTVTVDGLDQAAFWKSFRVGVRGHPTPLRQGDNHLSCSHDGFIQQGKGVLHTRTLTLLPNGFEILDSLEGTGSHTFEARFHCHPNVAIQKTAEHTYRIQPGLELKCHGAEDSLLNSDYFPEYGHRYSRPCLLLKGRFDTKIQFGIKCTSSF